MNRFPRFGIVGACGFLADAGALVLLVHAFGMHPLLARVLSIGFALSVTWLLNRSFTFGPSRRGIMREGARYGGIGIGTSLMNYLIYSAILVLAPWVQPLAALVAASAAAMLLSYLGYSRLVFDR